MNSFFGIGLPELVVILILAGLLMGPQRIRQVARMLGKFTAQLQVISRQFSRQLSAELDALDAEEVRGAIEDVKELKRELQSLRNDFSVASQDFIREGTTAVQDADDRLKRISPFSNHEDSQEEQTIRPPAQPDNGPLPKPLHIPDDPEV